MTAMHEPGYVGALHLHCLPFSNDVDDTFFFADSGLTKRLDQLQHLTQFGGMVLIVEGEFGSGKTTMLRQLIMRASNSWKLCHLQSTDIGTPVALIRQLALHFGLNEAADPHELRVLLADYFQVLRQTSQVPVVIVDDADRVPSAVFNQLLNLGESPAETVRFLRVVLFGAPGLTGKFVEAIQCDGASSLVHTLVLHPYDEARTDAYVMYRLALAGYSGESPFSAMEIRAIHKSAEGLPGRINNLAHQTLMEHVWASPGPGNGVPKGGRRGKNGHVLGRMSWESRWLGVGLAAFLVASIVWWRGVHYHSLEEPSDVNVVGHDLLRSHAEVSRVDDNVPAEEQRLRQSLGEPRITAEKSVASEERGGVEVGNVAAGKQPLTGPAKTPGFPVTLRSVNVPTSEVDRPLATSVTVPEAESAGARGAAEPALAQMANVPLLTAQADQESPSRNVEPVSTLTSNDLKVHRETWLLSQPAEAFTLQLLGVSQKSSVNRFLREHDLSEPVAYFHTYRANKDWYSLVYGVFADRGAATAAIASLPEALREAGPWPRSFSSIQSDIRASTSP